MNGTITINSVTQYITDEGKEFYERVLWIDPSTDLVVVIDLGKRETFPVMKKLSDLKCLIDSKRCTIVNYQSKRLTVKEEDLSETEKADLERSWAMIKDLVMNEPDIYSSKARGKMIRKTMLEHSVYKNYLYRKLKAYWRYGKVKNALLVANFNKGGKGVEKKSSEIKRGRPFKDVNCKNVGMNITEAMKDIFKKAYKKFYNEENMPLQKAYEKMLEKYFRVEIVADHLGKKVFSPPDGSKIPSFAAFKYWLPKLTNFKENQLVRYGRRDFELNHKAVLGESTSEAFKPGGMFQVDATIGDIYLVSRDNRNWIIGRPILYMVIDVFSRYIVGFYVGLEGPSWLGAMMALYNTARNKVELCKEYGIEIEENEWNCTNLPESLIVDRGELASTKPYNLINNLGINIEILPPYMAKWKGIVEQSFNKLNRKAIHWQSGSVVKKFKIRGDRDYRKDALLNLHEFTQIIIHSILYFNNTHMDYYVRSEHMLPEDVSRIPSAIWEWGIENRAGLLKSFPEDIIKLNLMPTANASITFKGLVYKKMRYSCPEDIVTGEYEKARVHGSKLVKISYDPRDLRCVYLNEGQSYKKYTFIGTQKTHLYEEEIEFIIEQENFEKRDNVVAKIANTAKLDANLDSIDKKAKKDAERQGATGDKQTKDIREKRKAEKEANRKDDSWELNKAKAVSGGTVLPFDKGANDDEPVPAPSYIDDIDTD